MLPDFLPCSSSAQDNFGQRFRAKGPHLVPNDDDGFRPLLCYVVITELLRDGMNNITSRHHPPTPSNGLVSVFAASNQCLGRFQLVALQSSGQGKNTGHVSRVDGEEGVDIYIRFNLKKWFPYRNRSLNRTPLSRSATNVAGPIAGKYSFPARDVRTQAMVQEDAHSNPAETNHWLLLIAVVWLT